MPVLPSTAYRVGRSKTGLGLFATEQIKKGAKIVRYFGPLLDSENEAHDAIENKYLFQISKRWTIDGSVRANVARYINHACKPNAESVVSKAKRRVTIRAIKQIEPDEEINYDYGTEYFKAYLKPLGCRCDACEKKRIKKAEAVKADKAAERKKARPKAPRGASETKATTKTKAPKPATKTKAASKTGTVASATRPGAPKKKAAAEVVTAEGLRGAKLLKSKLVKSRSAKSQPAQAASRGKGAKPAPATPRTAKAA